MPHPIEQLIASLSRKPVRGGGFDPEALEDPNIDPSVRADLGLGAMEGEVRNRLFQAERTQPFQTADRARGIVPGPNATSPHEVTALRNLLGGVVSDRQRSPLVAQQATYDAQNALNLESMNQGFSGGPGQSPIQAREIERRNLEKEKLRQPVQLAGMEQAGLNQRHDAEMGNRLEHARIQMEPARMDAVRRQQIQEAGGNSNYENDPRFKGYDRYGNPQFHAGRADPNANVLPVQRDLARAEPGSDDYMQSARTLVTQAFRHDPTAANDFIGWLQDPFDNGVEQTFEMAFPKPPAGSDPADLRDWNELRRLATLFGKQ